MASRCSTALVEPPNAITTAIAFSNDSLVMMSRVVMPRRSSSTTAWPLRRANPSRLRSVAGGAGHGVGGVHAAARPFAGTDRALDRVDVLTWHQPARTGADGLERVDDRHLTLGAVRHLGDAGQDRAGVEEDVGQVEAS